MGPSPTINTLNLYHVATYKTWGLPQALYCWRWTRGMRGTKQLLLLGKVVLPPFAIVYHLNFSPWYNFDCSYLLWNLGKGRCRLSRSRTCSSPEASPWWPCQCIWRSWRWGYISIEDIEDDDDVISNPKSCDEVEHPNFAAHTAHLDKVANVPKGLMRGRGKEVGWEGVIVYFLICSYFLGGGGSREPLWVATCSWRRTR